MTKTIIACVGSSLLTVGLLTVLGAGPLTPPPGPISPTSVSLTELADAIGKLSPGVTVPGRAFSNGGSVTFTFGGSSHSIPLIGYSVERVKHLPGSTPQYGIASAQAQVFNANTITLAFEAGRYASLIQRDGVSGAFAITLTGSDGTVFGPAWMYMHTRQLVNGPTAGGNKAIDLITFYIFEGFEFPMHDQSGSGEF